MTFQIHWANPSSHQAPDSTERVPITGIDPQFVISRSPSGEILSIFEDDSWDCRPYGAESPFRFDSWWDLTIRGPMDPLARTITNEIKTLHWLSGFETTTNASRSRGMSSLIQLMTILRALAKQAYALNIPLSKAHTSNTFQVALRSSIANADSGYKSVYAIHGLFTDIAFWQGVNTIKCKVPRLILEDHLAEVLALVQKAKNAQLTIREQTALIPTRLLGKLIGGCLDQLREAEQYIPKLESFIKAVYSDPYLLVDNKDAYTNGLIRVKRLYPEKVLHSWHKVESPLISTSETIERYGLSAYAEKIGLPSLVALQNHITHLQFLCALLIHAFTGMRASEVRVMPFEPVVHQAAKGFGDIPVLVSHLKKFSREGNYSRALVWATSEEGIFAVRIAQQLARLNWFRNKQKETALPSSLPLFIGPRIDRIKQHSHYEAPISVRLYNTQRFRTGVESLGLTIEQEDLDELRVFDAFREWDENPAFTVGSYWPLSTHQFRRSVAVYASRSGMVSLPTLKTQYKHLSTIMTALYAENSTYAQSFLIDEKGKPIDKSSVLQSFRDSVVFNTSVRFHEQVIKSEGRLYGPVGTQIQRAKDKGKLPKMLANREATEKAVKQGRYSYKETPVGGCTLKGSCPHFAIDLVLPCTSGCKDAILKAEKLEAYVDSLRFDMEMLPPKSRPFQLIAKEIEYVTKTYLRRDET